MASQSLESLLLNFVSFSCDKLGIGKEIEASENNKQMEELKSERNEVFAAWRQFQTGSGTRAASYRPRWWADRAIASRLAGSKTASSPAK